MSKKLSISMAVLAVAIASTACDKIPSGKTNQSGSVRTEADEQANRQRTAQERSDQAPNRANPGETQQARKSTQPTPGQSEQARKSNQAASEETEQASKSSQATPGGTEQQSEPGRQQAAEAGEDRRAESNTRGQRSQRDRTIVQNGGGTPAQSAAQPNQPQQDQAQPIEQQNRPEQNQQAKGSTNLSPEQTSGPVNLSRDEIRHLQMVLNQKGFNVGKPDGVLGPRTRNALISFQRQQGLEASGKIDQPTIAALGLSNGSGSTATGQSGAGTP